MAPRITIVFAILAFTVVNVAGLLKGKDIMEVWLMSLVGMVFFSILGFILGLLFDRLIKENMHQEEALMFSRYLEDNPEAGGENSEMRKDEENSEAADEEEKAA